MMFMKGQVYFSFFHLADDVSYRSFSLPAKSISTGTLPGARDVEQGSKVLNVSAIAREVARLGRGRHAESCALAPNSARA